MEIKVKSSYLKVSPRKVRPALYGLRGQNAEIAKNALLFTNKKGAAKALDLLKSAIAIAKENDLDLNNLFIKTIFCNEGPRLKRRQIKARGRSDAIKKRMSHLTLILSDEALAAKKKEIEKESKEIKDKKDIKTEKEAKKQDSKTK